MKKIKQKTIKRLSLLSLIFIIGGMFCVGMFVPPVKAEVAPIEPVASCHGQRHFTAKDIYFNSLEAVCCYNRPYNNQAIIDGSKIRDSLACLGQAVCQDFDLINNFSYNFSQSVEVFPPPIGEALSSVIKKE